MGIGESKGSAEKAISESYRMSQYDEFVTPEKIETDQEKFVPIEEKDSLILFNFRADRTKELTWAFVKKDFKFFRRKKYLENLYFASFAFHEEYEEKLPVKVVFKVSEIVNPIAEVLSKHNLSQFHIAETEKYAHVTYFFNGGKDRPFQNEERQLIPSPKVATYDLKPEMSAEQVCKEVLRKNHKFDFTIVNFANPDMVGHTGNLKATIKACEEVDECIGKIVESGLKNNKVIIISADHGNAEQMINPNTGEPHTEHTTNPVPFICVSNLPALQNPLKSGEHAISDIAPTVLKIMNLDQPPEMSGQSLIN
jgi:2,3-bisphosphoglycerate-independent phosphoglycerate mutase